MHPGDHITGRVSVDGANVTVSLHDATSGHSVSRTLQATSLDTSSAEWIAEAPSACDGSGDCPPLPLADFGTVGFTNSATAAGHTGSISDPAWQTQGVAMDSAAPLRHLGAIGIAPGRGRSSASAAPTGLSSGGAAFSVSWSSAGEAGMSAGASSGDSASGDGGIGSGYSGDPGYSDSGDPWYGSSADPGYGSSAAGGYGHDSGPASAY